MNKFNFWSKICLIAIKNILKNKFLVENLSFLTNFSIDLNLKLYFCEKSCTQIEFRISFCFSFNNFCPLIIETQSSISTLGEISWFNFHPLNGNLASKKRNKENSKRFTKCPVEIVATWMFSIVFHFWLSFRSLAAEKRWIRKESRKFSSFSSFEKPEQLWKTINQVARLCCFMHHHFLQFFLFPKFKRNGQCGISWSWFQQVILCFCLITFMTCMKTKGGVFEKRLNRFCLKMSLTGKEDLRWWVGKQRWYSCCWSKCCWPHEIT